MMESQELSVSSEPGIPWRASSGSTQSEGLSGVVRLDDSGGKLYGRSQELDLLEDVFKRVVAEERGQDDTAATSSIKHEIVLVSGESGSGKSSLVRTFRDGVRENSGQSAFFVEGKFDQNQETARPYSAIADAVTQLCHLIRESDYFEEILESIKTTLSGEISVLLDLVPAIEVITKGLVLKNEQTERASSNHAFKLFMSTFRSFLKVVCQAHPLVIFLDDLQWADDASRQLISAITSDVSITNFFFIGAFRDDEIDPSSILSWVGRPSETGLDVVNILVGPLDSDSVNKMVADLTERRIDSTKELSELVGRKTGRNAYFLAQYMAALQRQGLLTFSFRTNRWKWDLEQIESGTDVSENVVGLLIGKINGMAPDVQRVLMLASCLGFVFDVDALERIVISEGLLEVEEGNKQEKLPESTSQKEQYSPGVLPGPYNDLKRTSRDTAEAEVRESFHRAVKEAVKENLIEEAAAKFKFSHDRVQQAAYALMPSGDNSYFLHVRIGKVLLEMSGEIEEGEWLFFAGVDLLTKFASQASDEGFRVELARLSLEAGKRAEKKSAFLPSKNYLLGGIQLLDPTNRWTEHYELCLELHIKAAEVGRTYGDFHETLALVEEILAHGQCLKDRLRALLIKAYVLGGQNMLLEAIDTCMGALKQMGIRLPSNPKTFHVLFEYARTKRILKGRKARDLLSLPRTSDEMEIETIRFLNAASIFAWHADLENVASFVFLRMMRLTLKDGLCKFSPFAFATFGMLLAAIGEHKEGYEFGRVALELHDHLEDSRDCIASTTVVVESCLTHLRKPLYDSLAPMLESHQIGMATGEIEFAALCLSGHGGMSCVGCVGLVLLYCYCLFSHGLFCITRFLVPTSYEHNSRSETREYGDGPT
jgi:predicted ATPase